MILEVYLLNGKYGKVTQCYTTLQRERQYLHTCKVNRYRLLILHARTYVQLSSILLYSIQRQTAVTAY